MRRMLIALIILGTSHCLIAQSEESKTQPSFRPAEVQTITDIQPPAFCQANGVVVLSVPVSETGEAGPVEVRRDASCLTELAVQAVSAWSFTPATNAGQTVASRAPVAVVFRPPDVVVNPLTLPDLKAQSEAASQAEFQPAEILHAAFPAYPYETVAYGTVVVEAVLSEKGIVKKVNTLRDIDPLTAEAKAALAKWQFMPATFNGHPVPSNVIVAFVFRLIYNPPPSRSGQRPR